MKRDDNTRAAVLRVLKRAKKPLTRIEIAERMPDSTLRDIVERSKQHILDALPLAAMQREGTVRRVGERRFAKYEAAS